MQFFGRLTAFVRINRLAVSTVSAVGHVSSIREHKFSANILEQLVHSVRCERFVSGGNQGGGRTPFIFIGYFIGMSGLSEALMAIPLTDCVRLFTVTSTSGYAFITREPLLVVITEQKANYLH